MKNLIMADIRRILRKRSFLIVLAIVVLSSAGLTLSDKANFWNGFVYAAHQRTLIGSIGVILVGMAVFAGIYVDEFTSRSMQTVIGRGMSRKKILLAKIIDCVIVTFIVFAFFLICLLILGLVSGAHMTGEDVRILSLYVFTEAFNVICCAPLAAIILYLTDNGALAFFAEVALLLLIPAGFELLKQNILFHNLHIDDYYVGGFINRAYSEMVLTGGGLGILLSGAAIYLVAAFLLSYLVFRKKELDL